MKTINLGGTDAVVGKIGMGLMLMTWRAEPVPDEQCFEAMKAAIDHGATFFNSSEFYGINPRTANLELINRFCKKYPEYADKFFLSVKGGTEADSMMPNGKEANVRRSVETSLEKLGRTKIDLFEPARVDPKTPIEETVAALEKLRQEGKIGHIGLSECSANTLRRASKVAKITAVEIEVSLWSWEEETKKVIDTAKELGVTVVAYAPLGRGFLTGTIKSPADLKDFRGTQERFAKENFDHNMKLANALKEIAEKKGITAAQLCIAWVASLGDHVMPLPGSSHVNRTIENIQAGDVVLTAEDHAAIEKAQKENPIIGARYSGHAGALVWG